MSFPTSTRDTVDSTSPDADLRRWSEIFRDDDADLEARSSTLEALSAHEVVRGALELFGADAVISTAFGSTGLCLLHMAQQIDPGVRAYYIDTGFAFPETVALVARWKQERQLNLRTLLPIQTPEEQATQHGDALWERDPDLCCAMRKTEPNRRALSTARLWIAALRRDESPSRSSIPMLQRVEIEGGRRILKLSPLVRWTKKDVWAYILEHELPYNPLHDAGYPSIGCTHCTRAIGEGEDERAGRWSGREKLECGLHVHEPDR